MVNIRPAPRMVAARLREIERRYANGAKVGKRTRSMAAIRISELMRWMADVAGDGCELEPSDRSADIARLFVHHFVVLADGNRRAADWMDTHCPWIARRDREAMITEANHCPLKWSADKLGWKIRLTDEQRTRLKIRTIGAMGISKEQRVIRRKAEHRARQARLRAAKRVARAQHIG